MTPESAGERLRCHQCGSDDLLLTETAHEHAQWDSIVVTKGCELVSLRDATLFAGEIQTRLTRLECSGCGHAWRPRRRFLGVADDLTVRTPTEPDQP